MDNIKDIFNEIKTKIAQKHLNVHTLEERKNDNLDFHTCAVWNIKKALEEAFMAGVEIGAGIALIKTSKT